MRFALHFVLTETMAESLEDVQGKILAREAELSEEQDKELCKLLRAELVQLREKENILLRRQEGQCHGAWKVRSGHGAGLVTTTCMFGSERRQGKSVVGCMGGVEPLRFIL